jgi:Asp-tRNA(Asn)/Glu-tRNA(Gln) amidotransferase C subunit
MEEQVKKISSEYGLNLSEEEIRLVARQAAQTEQLFQSLHELDLTNVMPILKLDTKLTKK